MNRSLGINYLRFFTAFSVLLTHFGTPDGNLKKFVTYYHILIQKLLWSNGGLHFGVIIFVVMSGFLIHNSSKQTKISHYYIKRFIRIYPLFLIAAFIGLWITDFNKIADFFINASLLSSIIPNNGPPGNEILLTVVVEMAIYILYIPLRKLNMFYVLLILFILYIINFLFLLKIGIDSTYIERNLFSLLLYWFIGAASAEFFIIQKNIINLKACIILFIIYIVFSNFIQVKGLHYLYSFIFAIFSANFIAYLYINDQNKLKNETIFNNIINYLGEAAYSIYAWHLIVLTLIHHYINTWNSINYITSIALTLIISTLSYKFIEKYFNNKRYIIITYFEKLNKS